MTSPAPRRGRPPKLNRQAVVDAALALLEREGYDAISVRRLAAELGVSTFAVQAHMGSKDELLDDVVMELVAAHHTSIRSARSWRQALLRYATAMWDLLLQHPAVLEVLLRNRTSPEPVVADLEHIALLAERDGLTPEELAEVFETVWSFVLGYAGAVHARAGLDERGSRAALGRELGERQPHAAALASALAASDRREAFDRRLKALVDALAAAR